jgi:hypothetical protein
MPENLRGMPKDTPSCWNAGLIKADRFVSANTSIPELASPGPGTIPTTQSRLRRLPRAPLGGWDWLTNKRGCFQSPFFPGGTKERPTLALPRSRRMRRCARGILLWALLWYVVVQLFPLLLKDRWQRIASANEARKWPALHRRLARDPDRPLLLMLGSSRTAWAFRAGVLDGMPDSDGRRLHVYNFGIPTSGPISQRFYLRDLLAQGIRPRFLLIEVLPPLLCQPQRGALTEEGMIGFEDLSLRRLLQWAPYLHRPGKRVHAWLEARIAPWYTYRHALQVELKCLAAGEPLATYPVVDAWGWTILTPLPWPADERDRRLEVTHDSYSPGLGRFCLDAISVQALHELLDLCRRENILAALVVMPESSQFRSWYSEDGKAAIRGLLDELSRSYGVPVIDAQCWLDDDDFEDGHHVLLHGADVFTSRLQTALPRLLAQSQDVKAP